MTIEEYLRQYNIPEEFFPVFNFIPQCFWGNIIKIDNKYWELIKNRNGADLIIPELKNESANGKIIDINLHIKWESIALFYRYNQNQYHQAIQIIQALYDQMIDYQIESGNRIHKGMPLVWLRDFHLLLEHPVLAKRYAMLTLCEDVIRDFNDKKTLNKNDGGIYFRLNWYHGMSDKEIDSFSTLIYEKYKDNQELSKFPEWIIQNIDNNWLIENPSLSESMNYKPNLKYINLLLDKSLTDTTGKFFEYLSDYILSNIPGFRTNRRKLAESTDYDNLCIIEGINADFRSELGRYVICECKNWAKPADFTVISKFCSVIDSVKCKTGILFSKEGVTGEEKNKFAEREMLKIFQRNGISILIIDENDIRNVASGYNFINILRNKYEKIRFDLRE
ncbi:MAG: hypothetical protein AB2L13_10855 [Spirochaetota bacterium]